MEDRQKRESQYTGARKKQRWGSEGQGICAFPWIVSVWDDTMYPMASDAHGPSNRCQPVRGTVYRAQRRYH